MFQHRRLPKLLGALLSVLVFAFVAACGGDSGNTGGNSAEDEGTPVAGGSAIVLQSGEPRSLDPAALSNTWSHQATLGNALYGALVTNNIETFAIEYKMVTDFSTTDNGATFNLVLRPGLTFTDGTPFDAEAVKFNWDRLKDPALASTSIRQAVQVASTEVVDPTTLKVTMAAPNPHFPESVVAGALNWIASPTALQKGTQAYDEAPAGAGPFTVVNWTRQDSIELAKNPNYYDAPKPYLDKMTIRTVADSNQRYNAIITGAADLASETNLASINKTDAAGMNSQIVPTGGGQYMGMNQRIAPFDDVRARRAIALATDVAGLNTVVYNGENEIPETLFPEGSPFYENISLQETNKAEAQKLLDELAAEGKPVSFTFLSYPTTESKVLAEGLQTQLSTFKNLEIKVEVADFAALTSRAAKRDFQMLISSAIIQDPDFPLWSAFHSKSAGNFVGVNDAQLDAALDAGRLATSDADRAAAYKTVQERLVTVVPGIWYTKAVPAVVYSPKVKGVDLYTLGSPLPENFWIN